MGKSTYSLRLMREIGQFARDNRAYWMVPLFIILGLASLVIVGTQAVAPLIYALSVIAIIYTSLVALAQEDMKKLIAYSSVAHMGFVTIGIFTAKEAKKAIHSQNCISLEKE